MISYYFSHMSSYDLLTPHWQVRFGVDLFLSKLIVRVHTKLPPCKIVYIFLLDWAGSGCESEGCTAVFNTVWTVILRSFNSLAMCCMKGLLEGWTMPNYWAIPCDLEQRDRLRRKRAERQTVSTKTKKWWLHYCGFMNTHHDPKSSVIMVT